MPKPIPVIRILFDHCVTRKLARYLPNQNIEFAGRIGWANLNDSALLDAMVERFDVLITTDQNLRFQQSMAGRAASVIVLQAPSGHVRHLAALASFIEQAIQSIEPGSIIVVAASPG
jgi:predicted nuclease of predicted toxin-antitoxin system